MQASAADYALTCFSTPKRQLVVGLTTAKYASCAWIFLVQWHVYLYLGDLDDF
jgi:hypothetical protein